jgi:hypothetical protein
MPVRREDFIEVGLDGTLGNSSYHQFLPIVVAAIIKAVNENIAHELVGFVPQMHTVEPSTDPYASHAMRERDAIGILLPLLGSFVMQEPPKVGHFPDIDETTRQKYLQRPNPEYVIVKKEHSDPERWFDGKIYALPADEFRVAIPALLRRIRANQSAQLAMIHEERTQVKQPESVPHLREIFTQRRFLAAGCRQLHSLVMALDGESYPNSYHSMLTSRDGGDPAVYAHLVYDPYDEPVRLVTAMLPLGTYVGREGVGSVLEDYRFSLEKTA